MTGGGNLSVRAGLRGVDANQSSPKPGAPQPPRAPTAGAFVTNRGNRAELRTVVVAVSRILANIRILKGVFSR
jgi:hypothetical protein